MEKKPNNEISELLARLQQHVEKPSEPETDNVKTEGGESTKELLSLLKKISVRSIRMANRPKTRNTASKDMNLKKLRMLPFILTYLKWN